MLLVPAPPCTSATLLPLWSNIALTAGAVAIEALFAYPEALFRAIQHPVVWMGALLARLDRALNRPAWTLRRRRASGVLALAVLLFATVAPTAALQTLLSADPVGLAVLAVLASAMPAQRSLSAHVRAVADALDAGGPDSDRPDSGHDDPSLGQSGLPIHALTDSGQGDRRLAAGRRAVARIVGRDPEQLDEAGVVRAAIESLAENFSDAVVAPAFWGVVAGLAGMAGYKAVNTADSMIGHRTPRHEAFGWAAARLDDLINIPASRLAALFLIVASLLQAGADPAAAVQAVWRDARHHRSPNAGWPEAAVAGALGLRLAGPRAYAGVRVEDGWMGNGRAEATVADLRRALRLYRIACAVQLVTLVALAFLTRPG